MGLYDKAAVVARKVQQLADNQHANTANFGKQVRDLLKTQGTTPEAVVAAMGPAAVAYVNAHLAVVNEAEPGIAPPIT